MGGREKANVLRNWSGGTSLDRFEAFFKLEDGALEEVVGEGGGGYGETEGARDADSLVGLEEEHARKAIGCVEDRPDEKVVDEIQAVGDLP